MGMQRLSASYLPCSSIAPKLDRARFGEKWPQTPCAGDHRGDRSRRSRSLGGRPLDGRSARATPQTVALLPALLSPKRVLQAGREPRKPRPHEQGHRANDYAPADTLVKLGSAKSKVDVSAWEEFLSELVEPVGRARRSRAVRSLRNAHPERTIRSIPVAQAAHRWGRILEAVTEVLKAAGASMQAQEIHAAVEKLLGEPASWSSVRNCLASDVHGKSPRFERVGHGRYRMATPSFESR
jgi:hypothetical protein